MIDEERIPKYRNMSIEGENKFYNNLMEKMSNEYCRWYGSAYGLGYAEVCKLRNAIFSGKTTFTKWKKELADANIRANMGLGPNSPIPTIKRKISVEKIDKKIRDLFFSLEKSILESDEFKVMIRNICEDFNVKIR